MQAHQGDKEDVRGVNRGNQYLDSANRLWTVVEVYKNGKIAICGDEGITIKPVPVEILDGWKELK